MLSTFQANSKQQIPETLIACLKSKSALSELQIRKLKQDIKMTTSHQNKTLISSLTKLQQKSKQNKREQLKWRHPIFSLLAIFSIIQLVACQDFEDLNINSNKQSQTTLSNGQLAHHSFQPLNRLPAQQQAIQQGPTSNSRYTMQRPILSSRFAPSYSPSAGGQSSQLTAQASSSSSVFSGPPNSISASLLPQQVSSGSSSSSSSVSNIELLMKNALARTAQLNSAASAEPRQDTAAPSQQQPELSIQTTSSRSPMQQAAPPSLVAKEAASSKQEVGDRNAESSETLASEAQPGNGQSSEDSDSKSTTAAQTTTTSGHETVYSDQRFANLFARRGNNKKSRITPSEQVKAKPTLPSFIKSPPDPKQFTATQAVSQENVGNNNNNRPNSSSGANSFASQRLLGQNQNRLNQINNQQKKPVITSTSAANANNKRVNSQIGKPQISSTVSANSNKNLASNLNKSSTNKPNFSAPSNNNPFNRSQQGSSSSDSANVIAMARKRLLANNALESAKLKQQQQKQTN